MTRSAGVRLLAASCLAAWLDLALSAGREEGGPVSMPACPACVYGGDPTANVFDHWIGNWRNAYQPTGGTVPELPDASLPLALRGMVAKVVMSSGGVASGVVTEGMGYGLLIEGIRAAAQDPEALGHGLALMRSWLGMVNGADEPHPAGGGELPLSATNVSQWPYGVSAVGASRGGMGPSGVAAWKFPKTACKKGCAGSATDGDEDAVLGMIYLAATLRWPDDFVDTVMRAVIAFASADLGFPDLFRTLPGGEKVYVPKGGSSWGGLLPPKGRFASAGPTWCYSPGYFAPAHYRLFRDFARRHWRPAFDAYLPPHLDGRASSLSELVAAFDGAVRGGYNILFRSSCESGSVANWVGVQAPCGRDDQLSCPGVPWASTPYVGAGGQCNNSGTPFGSYGPDASRTPWRIALDYVLYTREATDVTIYDTAGRVDPSVRFNAEVYLHGFQKQYKRFAKCDPGDDPDGGWWKCSTMALSAAFDPAMRPPNVTCHNVPYPPETWWSHFMAYPTFATFVAPFNWFSKQAQVNWIDTFATQCDFSKGYAAGSICSKKYFESSQEVIASMIMAGRVVYLPGLQPQPPPPTPPPAGEDGIIMAAAVAERGGSTGAPAGRVALASSLLASVVLAAAAVAIAGKRRPLGGSRALAAGGGELELAE